jgi:GDP-4-dehydro-6-deoxy-D-mannose reductase
MRALVTGINGFVGTHLARLLEKENIDVIGVDRQTGNNIGKQYIIDLNDTSGIRNLIEDIKPDQIYHLAAPAFIPDSYDAPLQTFRVILDGTLSLLEIIRTASPYSKLLFVGSSDEYGMWKGESFREDMLPDPCTPYAAAKAAASILCRQYALFYGINVVRTRSFNHFGPGQSPRFVCSNMAKQIAGCEKKGEGYLQLGDITVCRDFIDVRDAVRAYYTIMCREDNAGEVYNICTERQLALAEILNFFLAISPLNGTIEIRSEQQFRKFDNKCVCGNNGKLKTLGWTEMYSLEQTIQDTLDYWRKQND